MNIVDNETEYNYPGDAPDISTRITIHVRGRSSRLFDKSSYAIRLVTEDGLNNNPLPVITIRNSRLIERTLLSWMTRCSVIIRGGEMSFLWKNRC